MKKIGIFLVVCLFAMSSALFIGCSGKWKEVQSVIQDGKTYLATFTFRFYDAIEITSDEYNKAPESHRIIWQQSYFYGQGTFTRTIDNEKSNLPQISNHDYVFILTQEKLYKVIANDVSYNSVFVKISKNKLSVKTTEGIITIKDSDGKVIISRNSDGKIEARTTDFYTVNYFI